MIFPIGDDQVQGGSKPIVSYTLIVINTLVFLYEASMPISELNKFLFEFGSIPAEVMRGQDVHTILTSMFLHGGWLHLIGNMLFLWVFADNIEAVIGSIPFLLFYIMGGIAANLVHVFVDPASTIPAVGASGAISAVLGAYLLVFPGSRIKVIIIYFFGVVRIPAMFFLGIWILQQLFSGIFALDPTAARSSGVAWWAHIGGFGFGFLVGFFIRRRYGKNPFRVTREYSRP